MTAKPESTYAGLPPLRQMLKVALMLVLLDAAALALNMHSWRTGGVTVLWPSNGLLLGVCLCAPRRQWPALLAIGFSVDLASNLILAFAGWTSVFFAFCNMVEVFVAAALMRRSISGRVDLTERRQFGSLLLYGVLLAPAVTSSLVYFHEVHGRFPEIFVAIKHWFMSDALGNAVVTPLYLSFVSGQSRERFSDRSWFEVAGLFALLGGVTVLVFWQMQIPLLFLILPVLLLLGYRLRLAGSAIGLLTVAIVGGAFTIEGRGPIAMIPGLSIAHRDLGLQIFIAVSMLTLYLVEVSTAERDRLQASLEESESRFRLLAEASSDVIVLSDLRGRREYVSPATAQLLGWQPEDLLGHNYMQIVHPDDIDILKELMARTAHGEKLEPQPYRVRKKDGAYLWMEGSLRLHHDPATGEAIGFVNVVRDISTRKAAEEQLTEAFRLVENLAMVDGLTGVPNRRHFDETLDLEWRRSMRTGAPLSLLMIDVDHFKRYNDVNGHILGDQCLREIATAGQKVLHRASDLFARYGGEEFAAVLPDTDADGAMMLAEQIRRAIESCKIPHAGNDHAVVTVSVGCATSAQRGTSQRMTLLHTADRALYQAKSEGRNCVRAAQFAEAIE